MGEVTATAREIPMAPLSSESLEIGPLQVRPGDHIARVKGRALMLSIRELRLLTELARRPDRIMSREELFRLAWGREMRVGDRSVDVYVRRLRVKLEQVLPGWRFIHTHFGFGYRLRPESPHSVPTHRSQVSNTTARDTSETRVKIRQGESN